MSVTLPILKAPLRQYFVPRNVRHHLPVYTDFRNGGAQCFILVKNIQGHTPALAKDLSDTLFDPADTAAARMRVESHPSRLVIKGASPDWKDRVVDWLRERGF